MAETSTRLFQLGIMIAAAWLVLVGTTHAADSAAPNEAACNARLSSAEEFFKERNDAKLVEAMNELSRCKPFELPPAYELALFSSYLEFRNGKIKRASSLLQEFKCMIKIDTGMKKCESLITGNKAERSCARSMCAEGYLQYYENPSQDVLAHAARYWAYADDLEEMLNAKGKTGRH